MKIINFVTLFPSLIEAHLSVIPFNRALKNNSLQINIVNLRNYALDDYGTVDDKPYGGGIGMVLMVEPIYKALTNIYMKQADFLSTITTKPTILVMSAKGHQFTQRSARKLKNYEHLTFICGRYEGIDQRVMALESSLHVEEKKRPNIYELSIGDFILSGGETAAIAVAEATVRLYDDIFAKEEATLLESFSEGEELILEHPQYTRPEDFLGLTVPHTLISGNHAEIDKWKKTNSSLKRPGPIEQVLQ